MVDPRGAFSPPSPLAEQERLLTEREQRLAEREAQLLSREQALVKRHAGQAEAEAILRQRAETLQRRAARHQLPAQRLEPLTTLAQQARLFDPASARAAEELARSPRVEALAQREQALRQRLAAAGARQRALEEREGGFAQRVELLRDQEDEVSRFSQLLDDLGPPLAPLPAGPPRNGGPPPPPPAPGDASGQAARDALVDAMVDRRGGAISTPVTPMLRPAAALDGSERRAAGNRRIGLRVNIGFRTAHNLFFTGQSHNLSQGGLFLATEEATLDLGQQVELSFSLPGGQAIQCRGEVAWIHRRGEAGPPGLPPGMGIRFLQLTPGDAARIAEFIAQRDPFVVDSPN